MTRVDEEAAQETGEMALWSTALAVLEDLNLSLSAHIVAHNSLCNSSSRGFSIHYGFYGYQAYTQAKHPHT